MSLQGLGILNYQNSKVSGEFYFIESVLPILIQSEKPVFYDVGANVGKYSASLAKRFPSSVIHAFEPHPKNFARLNAVHYPCLLKSYNVAIGASQGELTLYDRADRDGSSHASLHEAVISEIHKKEVVSMTVPVETLDQLSERENITYIDFIKIDTEGNELAVLQGTSSFLKNGNVGCIHFEFNEMNIISRCFFRDFRRLLEGYAFFRLLPDGLLSLNNSPLFTELFAFQNIVAIPEHLLAKLDTKLRKHIN